MIGRLLRNALERAGLFELAERALRGEELARDDIAVLERTDLLLLAGLADAVRQTHRGDEVQLLGSARAKRDPDLLRVQLPSTGPEGPTGEELLRQIALARLTARCSVGIAVNFEQLGLELAQTALAFGADVLYGDLETRRTLPLLSSASARRQEIAGLVERAGRRVRFVAEAAAPSAESAS